MPLQEQLQPTTLSPVINHARPLQSDAAHAGLHAG
jgi:hypothetical protein